MQPHSIVVVSLHSPKERLWGELVDVSNAGVTVRGIDLSSFDDFISQEELRALSDQDTRSPATVSRS